MQIIERNGVTACLDCAAIGMSCCQHSVELQKTNDSLVYLLKRQEQLIIELRSTVRMLSKNAA